jgi:hypothetical protein
MAELNNTNLENSDLLIQIQVLNEKSLQNLYELELMDCLKSLNYFNTNLRKLSVYASEDQSTTDVQVAE